LIFSRTHLGLQKKEKKKRKRESFFPRNEGNDHPTTIIPFIFFGRITLIILNFDCNF